MSNLNSHNIEQIQNYFITTDDTARLVLQNNIAPIFLKRFLSDLKSLFILEPDNETKLISLATSMGASNHLEDLKEIQQQFYSHLAEIYLNGNTNFDINKLLKVKNQRFLIEVNYQKQLSAAFILSEREELKKRFQSNDKGSEIGDEEIALAFKGIERERIKNLFISMEEIEREEEQKSRKSNQRMYLYKEDSNVDLDKRRLEWPADYTSKFNWKRFAIAASIIGLIVTTTFIIFTQDKKEIDVVSNKATINTPYTGNDSLLNNQTALNPPILKPLPPDLKQVKILKEQSFGFAAEDEYLKLEIYNLESYLESYKDSVKNEINPIRKDLYSKAVDSLKNMVNRYSFQNNLLKIYIPTKQKVKVFKIENEIYFQIDNTTYECKESKELLPLKKISDKQTLNTIDKILFNE